MEVQDKHCHEDFLGYRIFRTQYVVTQLLAKEFAPYGVTPIQWNALVFLDRFGSLSQRQLATHLHREPATITRAVDKLESMGLVAREPDASDRRVNVITPTDKARGLLAEIQPAAERAALVVQSDLSDEEAKQLMALLDRVYEGCLSAE
ncbi:MarR family winged helix-turn-helix transcriptional regulator [uncultured Slackia sp.]|uniref:MarR family winged helix-turn-helix transcriptional regulator n=1 Tax=uncultured Slackia sp. TaxID=665903 RepID=UPI002600E4DB|nr:MarR family transcriptional regulator [uncultured Slackia sp.]